MRPILRAAFFLRESDMSLVGVKSELADIKRRVDIEIERYLDRAIRETEHHNVFMAEALRTVKTLALSGGKRLRAAFMYQGYLAGGGEDRERMIRTAVSIELIHLFLLIHDDIIDRDAKRHGVPTLHEHFREVGDQLAFRRDTAHFGNSMAIISGDMVGALGNQIIFESGFEPDRVLKALAKLQEIVSFTVVGEAEDIMIEYRGKASETEILSMYEHKTARYTVDGPLQLGLLLAGGPESLSRALGEYAVPVGIAFQIQDDILGVFGSEERIGKPVGSDIEEGKITMLVSKALEMASREDGNEIRNILSKGEKLASEDISRFRDILTRSGSLDASRAAAREFLEKGCIALRSVDMPQEPRSFLLGVAEYMMSRDC